MATPPAPGSFLLFVSGEPGPPETLSPLIGTSVGARLFGSVIPASWFPDRTPPPGPRPEDWHVPREEVATANLVFEIARETGRPVALVNANGSGTDAELASKWVGANDLLPVLVRSDGERLVGLEQFRPKTIRTFMAGK